MTYNKLCKEALIIINRSPTYQKRVNRSPITQIEKVVPEKINNR